MNLNRLKVAVILSFAAACGCGVRGDPASPLSPAEIGRGHPTYKGYAEDYRPAAQITEDKEAPAESKPINSDDEDEDE